MDNETILTFKSKNNRKTWIAVLVVAVLAVCIGLAVGIPLSQRQTGPTTAPPTDDPYLARARQILSEVPLIDGHNDLPIKMMYQFDGQLERFNLSGDMRLQFNGTSQTDIPRLREGMVGAQFWSAFTRCNCQYKDAVQKGLQLIDLIKRFSYKYSDTFKFVTSANGINEAKKENKIASLIGLEGGHMIASNAAVLRMFYELGVRYMTLTWNCNTPWADYSRPDRDRRTPRNHGLTDWGVRLIQEMNRIGMLVDLSHVSDETMKHALNVSRAPVIFSHSNARTLCGHPRNVPDDVIDAVKEKGGIIMANFYCGFINCNGSFPCPVRILIDHMEYIKNRTNTTENIGIGSDFDGATNVVREVNDVSKFPVLIAEMLKRGWTEEEVKKVTHHNFMRVFRQAEQVRDDLRGRVDMLPFETPINLDRIPYKNCTVYPWNRR